MKISREDKFILIVAFVAITLLAGNIWFGINYFSEKRSHAAEKKLNETLIQEKFKAFSNDRNKWQNVAKLSDHRADSVLKLVVIIQGQLKQNQIYYAKKIKDLSGVNTYSARQKYADSLANTLR